MGAFTEAGCEKAPGKIPAAAFDVGGGGGFNVSWLLCRPPGDKVIFDLCQSAGLLP